MAIKNIFFSPQAKAISLDMLVTYTLKFPCKFQFTFKFWWIVRKSNQVLESVGLKASVTWGLWTQVSGILNPNFSLLPSFTCLNCLSVKSFYVDRERVNGYNKLESLRVHSVFHCLWKCGWDFMGRVFNRRLFVDIFVWFSHLPQPH
jgi:hypothetical protein